MGKITLYHYTNRDGYDAIRRTKKILKSEGPGDAAFGNGVYLTDMSPFAGSKATIAKGNYDGIWRVGSMPCKLVSPSLHENIRKIYSIISTLYKATTL